MIADGGIKYSGDITKAIAAGADCVMIGGLFAGTEEARARRFCIRAARSRAIAAWVRSAPWRGLGADRYAQEGADDGKLVPEGIEGRVPYKGPLGELVDQLVGGLRGGHGLLRRREIRELQEKRRFVRITPAGLARKPRPRRDHHQRSAELPSGVKLGSKSPGPQMNADGRRS